MERVTKYIIKIALILTFIILPITGFSQSAPAPILPDDPEAGTAPIDGGLGILAALGGAYGIKKLRDKKQ